MNNKKGFTLAELLVVVAIIAVLVAIAIPVLSSQLEKAREATDLANIRAAYAELMTAIVTDDREVDKSIIFPDDEDTFALKSNSSIYCRPDWGWYYLDVELTQTQDGWQTDKARESLISMIGREECYDLDGDFEDNYIEEFKDDDIKYELMYRNDNNDDSDGYCRLFLYLTGGRS